MDAWAKVTAKQQTPRSGKAWGGFPGLQNRGNNHKKRIWRHTTTSSWARGPGCVLANRLSRDPATRVLLLEAGGRDNYHWIHIPVGYLHCIGNPRTDWMYRTASEPGLGGRSLIYPRGRVLGGCSSINGMIYMRGQREDYDQWAALSGDEAWSWDRVLPVFKRSEDHHRGASEHHGAGGEWRVESQRLRWDIRSLRPGGGPGRHPAGGRFQSRRQLRAATSK